MWKTHLSFKAEILNAVAINLIMFKHPTQLGLLGFLEVSGPKSLCAVGNPSFTAAGGVIQVKVRLQKSLKNTLDQSSNNEQEEHGQRSISLVSNNMPLRAATLDFHSIKTLDQRGETTCWSDGIFGWKPSNTQLLVAHAAERPFLRWSNDASRRVQLWEVTSGYVSLGQWAINHNHCCFSLKWLKQQASLQEAEECRPPPLLSIKWNCSTWLNIRRCTNDRWDGSWKLTINRPLKSSCHNHNTLAHRQFMSSVAAEAPTSELNKWVSLMSKTKNVLWNQTTHRLSVVLASILTLFNPTLLTFAWSRLYFLRNPFNEQTKRTGCRLTAVQVRCQRFYVADVNKYQRIRVLTPCSLAPFRPECIHAMFPIYQRNAVDVMNCIRFISFEWKLCHCIK